MVAYLKKSEANADFAEIVDFLNASPISYALTVSPTIYVSYIEQFWSTAKTKTVNNETQIRARVDGKTIVITKSSVRRDLHFDDEDGITCLTNTEIFENLQLMGYEKLSDKLTFLKPFFSPQWKYLIHTILQCLSSKSTAWNEFGTNIASAVICLAKNQKFNFSKLIFDAVFNDEYDTLLILKRFCKMRRKEIFFGTVTHCSIYAGIIAVEVKGIGSGGSPCARSMRFTIFSRSRKELERQERKNNSRTPNQKIRVYKPRVESSEESLGKKDASKQGRNSDKTEELNVAEDEHMFDLSDLADTKVIADQEETIELVEDKGSAEKGVSAAEDKDSTADPVTTAGETVTTVSVNPEDSTAVDVSLADDVTLAEILMAIKSSASRPQKWDLIEARIDADAQLAERLQAEEREQMSVEEQARLLMEFIAARKKFFAAKRAEEQRNKPPTKAEQRKKMCTYMKHMAGYKDKKFKGKSFDAIKQMFDKAYKQVNDFVPMDIDSSGKKAESSKKRTRAVLGEESVKRQRVEDDAEKAELKACLDKEDEIWKTQQDYTLISWKLYDSCGVHLLLMDTGSSIHMLVEKKYPLTQEMLSRMLSGRLEVDHECEMAFELLRFTRSQLKK
ncbi:hypothetical protein Tco_0847725 [Tanacetum coccineum]